MITGFQWRATKLKIVAGEPRLRVADFQEIQVAIVPHIAIAAQTPHSATAELVILVKSATIVAMVLTEPVGLVGKDTQRRRTPIAVVQVKLILYLKNSPHSCPPTNHDCANRGWGVAFHF